MTETSRILTVGALFVTFVASAIRGNASTPKIADQTIGPWQLFVDDELIASKKNVLRRYHSFKKHPGNPLITVDKPWEAHVVNACSVLPGENGEGFRMYYYCWSESKKNKKECDTFMCYTVSRDGLKWNKPNLGLYEWDGSKDNNILPNGPDSVMYTPWEQDPNKRYQGVGGLYHAYSSPDGIHWKQESRETIISGGDTSHFYWDPRTKRFRCNVKGGANAKVGDDVSGLRRRMVGFSETNDLTRFPPLRMVMAPDEIDDLWCRPNSVQRTHFYACPVFPYETIYVGFLQIYRAEEPEGFFHGPLWLELVTSRDGIHWTREESDTAVRSATALYSTSRPPLLDIGKYREFDRGMVIAPPALVVGDELWIFYTGYDELHDLLPYRSAIGLATMRKDGFVSLNADECPGEIITKRLANVSGKLKINYDARGGSLEIEVLSADGRVIPGYAFDECEPLTGDSVNQAVAWKDKKELPANGGPIRLRFLLEHAKIYSFMPGENVTVVDEPAPPPLQALYTFDGDTEAWSDMLGEDGLQKLRNLGTCVLDHKKPDPAFGKRSLIVGSEWRPWNRVEILGTNNLGRHFTLAAMVKSKNNKHARLFSAYNGLTLPKTSELIFDFDPSGRILSGLRLVCKGITVESEPLTFTDNKYHHLAVVYDDGMIRFYLDGKPAGEQWIPGGEPVKLAGNLLIGEDANLGPDEQLLGQVDDVLVLGRTLNEADIVTLSRKGASVLFGLKP